MAIHAYSWVTLGNRLVTVTSANLSLTLAAMAPQTNSAKPTLVVRS